jgi:hypothetical protein
MSENHGTQSAITNRQGFFPRGGGLVIPKKLFFDYFAFLLAGQQKN